MNKTFEKWCEDNHVFDCPQNVYGAWNSAIDAVVEALRRRERLFRSKVEGEAVLNDLLRLKVE